MPLSVPLRSVFFPRPQGISRRAERLLSHRPYLRPPPLAQPPVPDALLDADVAAIISDHSDFKYLHPQKLGAVMRSKKILDPFGIIDRTMWEEAGFLVKVL